MDAFELLSARRRTLGMPVRVLSKRSGVSEPTVKRILTGDYESASFRSVAAVASALGMCLMVNETISPDELRERQAEAKARRLVALVQGTSALECQGLEECELDSMVRRSTHELLLARGSVLWDDDP